VPRVVANVRSDTRAASVTITFDRYGHLMPGNEDEAAALLDAYLERANTRARLDRISGD
jgi:hypothetical protein